MAINHDYRELCAIVRSIGLIQLVGTNDEKIMMCISELTINEKTAWRDTAITRTNACITFLFYNFW